MFSIHISVLLFFLATEAGSKTTRRILYWSLGTEPPIILLYRYQDLKEDLANKTAPPFIIDVREPDVINATGKIPTSFNIPFKDVNESMMMSRDDFQQKYNISKPLYRRRVVFYGTNEYQGYHACRMAVIDSHYQNVANYAGGWIDWYNHTMDEQDDRYWENAIKFKTVGTT